MDATEKTNARTATNALPKVEFCSHTQFSGFLARIVQHLRARGYDASHYYMVGDADYHTTRGLFSRIWLRIRMYALFPARIALHVLRARPGTIIVMTSNPFFAPLLAHALAPRGVKVVHLLYDLYPDALVYGGKLSEHSLVCRMIDRIQRATIHRCDANVILGRHLLEHVRERFGNPHNPVIIPVGADDGVFDAPLGAKSADTEPVRLLYCGNMGHMHDTATLAAAISQVCASDGENMLDFTFNASGVAYDSFRAGFTTNKPACVKLEGYLNAEHWSRAMSGADIAIVTMKNGSERVVMPSKAYSAMQAGQAILAIASQDSDLAALVREHECGWVIAPGDVAALTALLRSLPRHRAELRKMQENSLNASNSYYSAYVVSQQWEALFRSDELRS